MGKNNDGEVEKFRTMSGNRLLNPDQGNKAFEWIVKKGLLVAGDNIAARVYV